MNSAPRGTSPKAKEQPLAKLEIEGFKSIRDRTAIEIRPLTLLAGANSSGKSSVMQPLLLLKQTLEAPYDPGPLLLQGPNVRFTSMRELLWHGKRTEDVANAFEIGLARHGDASISLRFRGGPKGVKLDRLAFQLEEGDGILREGMSEDELRQLALPMFPVPQLFPGSDFRFELARSRCALGIRMTILREGEARGSADFSPFFSFERSARGLMHLPGLRGNPERAYPTTQVGNVFPGVFQDYVASVIASWKHTSNCRLTELGAALQRLGLTWKVEPKTLDETRVAIQVGRLPSAKVGGARDLVNIADVGFGVTQALPVVVALLAADPGQMVYLEQPEIHLHPKAQVALAHLLLEAAKRGVLVVAETHSHLVVKSVQEQVAGGHADPSLVKLHWFQREPEEGVTRVTSADLDAQGAYGDWPADFAEVELDIEDRFLTASLQGGS